MNRPESSFGSNQVDFGGMILPASAMLIKSLMVVGVHGERHRHPLFHPPFQLAQTPDAAYEIDALIRPRVSDAQNRMEQFSCKMDTSKRATGSVLSKVPGLAVSLYHFPPRYIP